MSFWAYILRCSDGHYYTGHTDNLEYRFAQHQAGGTSDFTSRRRPVPLFWSQEFSTRIEALEAERQIKPWSRAKKEALARGDWASLSYFARPPKERPSLRFIRSEVEGPLTITQFSPVRPERSRGTFPLRGRCLDEGSTQAVKGKAP